MPRRLLAALLLAALIALGGAAASSALARPVAAQPGFLFPWPREQQWYFSTGPHYGTGPNSGIDFAPPYSYSSRPVLAMAGGTVRWVQYNPAGTGLGWTVAVDHGGGWETWYSHFGIQPSATPGQRVPQGHYLGDTGNSCSGNCWGITIHVELRKDGRAVSWDGMVVDGWTVRSYAGGGGYLERGGTVVPDMDHGSGGPLASSNVLRHGCPPAPPTPTPTPTPTPHPFTQNAPFRTFAGGVTGGNPPPTPTPPPPPPPGC